MTSSANPLPVTHDDATAAYGSIMSCAALAAWFQQQTAMVRLIDPLAEYPATSVVAGAFALLVAAAWFAALPGISVAVAYYGAVLLSERLYGRWRASGSRRHRSLRLLGLALTWLSVLAYSALLLPSNFSTAVI